MSKTKKRRVACCCLLLLASRGEGCRTKKSHAHMTLDSWKQHRNRVCHWLQLDAFTIRYEMLRNLTSHLMSPFTLTENNIQLKHR